MKKRIIAVFIILLSIIVLLFWGNDEQDLGDNYYYLPKYEAIDLGYPGGAIIYKSPQKHLYSDIKIHREVVSVNSNNDFVIAIQKLDSSNTENDSLQYFIIVKESDLIFGPYNKKKYLQKRDALKVPKDLKLRD